MTALHLLLGVALLGSGVVVMARRERLAARVRSLALVTLLGALMVANGLAQLLLGVT